MKHLFFVIIMIIISFSSCRKEETHPEPYFLIIVKKKPIMEDNFHCAFLTNKGQYFEDSCWRYEVNDTISSSWIPRKQH